MYLFRLLWPLFKKDYPFSLVLWYNNIKATTHIQVVSTHTKGAANMALLEKWRAEVKANLPELLKEVATSIKSVHPDSTVILFGSYARGEQNDDSDLDICVLVPELTYSRVDMRVDARCSIREDFPLPMDVLLYTYDEFEESAKFRSRMHYKIKNEGVVLSA